LYQLVGTRDKGRATRGPRSDRNSQFLSPNSYCVVHVHGWDGNFYENRFIDHAAQVCSSLGIGFVSGNNRGHDYIADILRSRRNQKSETRNQNSELAEPSLTTKTPRHEEASERIRPTATTSRLDFPARYRRIRPVVEPKPRPTLTEVELFIMSPELPDYVLDIRIRRTTMSAAAAKGRK